MSFRFHVFNDCRRARKNIRLVCFLRVFWWTFYQLLTCFFNYLFNYFYFAVSCQTILSLPVSFNLEKVLGKPPINAITIKSESVITEYFPLESPCFSISGDYYCYHEACDAMQESLSSSSLRRKLFLDGQSAYSGSDCSSPPSPERSHVAEDRLSVNRAEGAVGWVAGPEGEAVSPDFSSPLSCCTPAPTPSTVSGDAYGMQMLIISRIHVLFIDLSFNHSCIIGFWLTDFQIGFKIFFLVHGSNCLLI